MWGRKRQTERDFLACHKETKNPGGRCRPSAPGVAAHYPHTKNTPWPSAPSADYMTKVIVKGKNSSSTKVAEIMTPAEKLVTVTPKHRCGAEGG